MKRKPPLLARRTLRRFARDERGATIIEIAVSLPLLMLLVLGGIEIVNLATLHMRLNQLAITVADNASRAKQTSVTGAPKMREFDVNDVFAGAALQANNLDFPTRGRVILSSLETNASAGQWIHWQRCWGSTAYASQYGPQGTGATGTTFAGMGPNGNKMTAEANNAIMFVEVAYQYRPIFFTGLVQPTVVRKEAAVYVRDDRDLSDPNGLSNPSPAAPQAFC